MWCFRLIGNLDHVTDGGRMAIEFDHATRADPTVNEIKIFFPFNKIISAEKRLIVLN